MQDTFLVECIENSINMTFSMAKMLVPCSREGKICITSEQLGQQCVVSLEAAQMSFILWICHISKLYLLSQFCLS